MSTQNVPFLFRAGTICYTSTDNVLFIPDTVYILSGIKTVCPSFSFPPIAAQNPVTAFHFFSDTAYFYTGVKDQPMDIWKFTTDKTSLKFTKSENIFVTKIKKAYTGEGT